MDGKTAEDAILAAWKDYVATMLNNFGDNSKYKKKINELGTKLDAEKGKHWLDFPGWGKIPPAEVLIFQPSITGASFSLTGVNISATAISLGLTFFKIRNGAFGFEPALVDNSNCLECSELLGSGMSAKLLADTDIVQNHIDVLTVVENDLIQKQNRLLEKHG